jgi:hypothetical protein
VLHQTSTSANDKKTANQLPSKRGISLRQKLHSATLRLASLTQACMGRGEEVPGMI